MKKEKLSPFIIIVGIFLVLIIFLLIYAIAIDNSNNTPTAAINNSNNTPTSQTTITTSSSDKNLVKDNTFLGVKFSPPSGVSLKSTYNTSIDVLVDGKTDGSIRVYDDPVTEDYFKRQYSDSSSYSLLTDDNNFVISQSTYSTGSTYLFVKKNGYYFSVENSYQTGIDLLLNAKIA